MKKYVLFPAFDKVLVEEGDSEVDHRLLTLLLSFKDVEITNLKPFYLDATIPDEIVSELKKQIKNFGGELHPTGEAVMIDPINPSESIFREMLFGSDDEPEDL